jgi:hypothetical protein
MFWFTSNPTLGPRIAHVGATLIGVAVLGA